MRQTFVSAQGEVHHAPLWGMLMQSSWTAAALTFVMMSAAVPAHACRISVPLDLDDVQHADVVVVGRITKYEIVLDRIARQNRQIMLAKSPQMPPELRKIWESQTRFLSDYARFEIVVDEVLAGKARKTLSVTWDNSTFGEPESMPSGQFLIALRDPSSRLPPLRGPSATILPNRELGSLTVLQAPCSSAFIFESAGEQAGAIRRILD